MIVRKINPDEAKCTRRVAAVAFEGEYNPEQSAEEYLEAYTSSTRERWAAFEDDNQTPFSVMTTIPYTMWYNGVKTGMCGIGGVATLPQCRNRGGVRKCFEAAFADMRDKGQIFSILYPFSRAYYRKFGYENFTYTHTWTVRLEAFAPQQSKGAAALLEPGDDIGDIMRVYEAFSSGYDFAVVREESDFSYMTKVNPYADKRYTYVWKNEDGVPKSYFSYKREQENGDTIMNCIASGSGNSDFCFSDAQGLRGLIDLLRVFAPRCHAVRFNLPADFPLLCMLNESNFTRTEQKFTGQLRIVDLKKALERSPARGTGSAVIAVTDAQCPWNRGTWEIKYGGGAVRSVGPTEKSPDAELTISDLAPLLSGACTAEHMGYLPGVRMHGNIEGFAGLFYPKKTWIGDHF